MVANRIATGETMKVTNASPELKARVRTMLLGGLYAALQWTRSSYAVAKLWLMVPLATFLVTSGLLTPTAARAITAAQGNQILQALYRNDNA